MEPRGYPNLIPHVLHTGYPVGLAGTLGHDNGLWIDHRNHKLSLERHIWTSNDNQWNLLQIRTLAPSPCHPVTSFPANRGELINAFLDVPPVGHCGLCVPTTEQLVVLFHSVVVNWRRSPGGPAQKTMKIPN